MTKPLTGLRVIDLTRILAGPWASQLLADLGAEVIKIERPGCGDDSRGYGPPFLKTDDGADMAQSSMFLAANRSKKSVTIDVSKPEGAEIVRRLIADADIFVENYKVGDMKRYGLDYETLSKLNPRLIYASVTGYGQTGPYSGRGGYDPVAQALCGMMSVTGLPESMPGGGPMKAGPSLVDIITGLYTVIGVQGALIHRTISGRGQHVDVALLDSGVAVMAQQVVYHLLTGAQPPPIGNQANGGAPGGDFFCADGRIMVAPGNQQGYERYCRTLGRDDLITDPRFLDNSLRIKHRELLNGLINDSTRQWKVADLHQALIEASVPSAPINSMADVVADPQVIHRNMLADVTFENGPTFGLVGNPIRYSETPITDYSAPPALGQHTDAILTSAGFSADEITALKDQRIV